MNPKHISKVPDARKAIAPYNFVELPEKVVEVTAESLPQENRYYLQNEKRYTGRIECTLTTESPLYIRCGLTKEEFECGVETKDLSDFFYTNPLEKYTKPVIPGSSLRGMLRNLVEIVSFSKLDKVSDAQKFFFRAVAAERDDPLKDEYVNHLGKQGKNVKAGYLQKQGDKWFIRPAKTIDNYPFVWIKKKQLLNLNFLDILLSKIYQMISLSINLSILLISVLRIYKLTMVVNLLKKSVLIVRLMIIMAFY